MRGVFFLYCDVEIRQKGRYVGGKNWLGVMWCEEVGNEGRGMRRAKVKIGMEE